jgi:hypothetical protein
MMPETSGERGKSEGSEKRDFFCLICYRAFTSSEQLELHMKTHRELDVSESSCKMRPTPAGVV